MFSEEILGCQINASFLADTGYRKPPKLSDKFEMCSVLKHYYTIAKVKPEIDQFLEGLETLGVLEMMRQCSDLMKVFFVPTDDIVLTRGEMYFGVHT